MYIPTRRSSTLRQVVKSAQSRAMPHMLLLYGLYLTLVLLNLSY